MMMFEKISGLFKNAKVEADLDEELRFHLEELVQQNLARGMTLKEAQLAARRSFGGLEQAKEECRDAKGGHFLERLGRDFVYGFRMLRKNRMFTLAAILTLSLGIGANTAIFSVVNNIFFRPLPFVESERLVHLRDSLLSPSGQRVSFHVSAKNFLRISGRARVFESISAQDDENVTLSGGQNPEQVRIVTTSAGTWQTLGIRPVLGRSFTPEEERAGRDSRVAMIAHNFWQQHFGGRSEVLGQQITINNENFTVVGVIPAGYNFPHDGQVWIPTVVKESDRNSYTVFGRLLPGITLEQGRAQLYAMSEQFPHEFTDVAPGYRLEVLAMRDALIDDEAGSALTLLVVVGFLLLLACANVASLMLVRSLSRRREFAIRRALGARNSDLVQQLLTEGILLSTIGTVIGLFFTFVFGRYLATLIPKDLGSQLGLTSVELDYRMICFAFAVALGVGALAAVLPAWKTCKSNLQGYLKDGLQAGQSKKSRRILNIFVVGEIALSFVLLAGAGMMFQNLRQLSQRDLGFHLNNLLTVRITLPGDRYPNAPQRVSFVQRTLESVAGVRGVTSSGLTTINPLSGGNRVMPVVSENSDPSVGTSLINHRLVSPGLFHTMGIPLIKGRDFTEQDQANSTGVVIVNESMARHFWPNQDPLGKRMRANRPNEPWLTVIGVVGDLREKSPTRETEYLPYTQQAATPASLDFRLMVRSTLDSTQLIAATQKAIWSVDPNLAVYDISTMENVRSENLSRDKLGVTTVILFASFGLILAALGIYALMAFTVGQRLRETAIRMALGAQKSDIVRSLLLDGSKLVLIGVALGVSGAYIAGRTLSSLLVEARPLDPLTYIGACVCLGLIAVLASVVPAFKAMRVNPVVVLRDQ